LLENSSRERCSCGKNKEIAAEYGIPIVEDKPLRALSESINTFLLELYVAVAKILAYIYKLKGRDDKNIKNQISNFNLILREGEHDYLTLLRKEELLRY
jgi:hypothetical protein